MLPRLIGEHIEYAFQPEPAVALLKADAGQIEQAIMNLAVNARDAMPEGGRLTIRTANVAFDEGQAAQRPPMVAGRYVLLSVTDTGHGMNDETKTHIFEPFFTTKEVGKGTGLGLATVYGVVKQSGGFIWVESSPGKGATFEIYLPQAVGATLEHDTARKPSAVPRGTETVLVAEDEEGVRELACRFLRSSGYSVLEAKDGLEALDVAARHTGTIHLVLSDIVMPRMGGNALATRLKGLRPHVKVILMSGYSEYVNPRHEETFTTLQKPFSLHSLVEAVRAALREPVAAVSGSEKKQLVS
jgi:two-component system cell cycle sensor histidine kinase/response regulator CckA